MRFIRINPHGLTFRLSEINSGQTQVLCLHNQKTITVDQSLEYMRQAWFYWQYGGKLIQDAFSELPAEQREFFLTGLTPEAWSELFKEED